MNLYDFAVKDQEENLVNLSEFKGKPVLIVNTATECGFTPQYEDLQRLYDNYHEQGFEILDFPCNQFGNQAPGSDEEIHQFCTGRFGVTFPQYTKIEVLGENQEPLYKWLTENAPFKGFDLNNPIGARLDERFKAIDENYQDSDDIKWNFTKFLIDKDGNIVKRFEPTEPIENIEESIKEVI